MSVLNPILFTLRESRWHPIFCVAKGLRYETTASTLDAPALRDEASLFTLPGDSS